MQRAGEFTLATVFSHAQEASREIASTQLN